MTETAPISQDRQNAIRLMQSRGWSHRRDGQKHKFTRPDTAGLYDVAQISHGNLSLQWAITHCADEELARRVQAVRDTWVREALPAIFEDQPHD